MAYNKFTVAQLQSRFDLQLWDQTGLFQAAPSAVISDRLRATLAEDAPLALPSGSEKARSEYIIAPILAEVYRRMGEHIGLFSGVEFDVDPANGLLGYCDFLFTLSPLRLEIQAPIIAVVEAKKENILSGIPQCLAELIAAQQFNAAAERPLNTLYGVVTTGQVWKFLRLHEKTATIDQTEYYLAEVEKIVGIFLWMLREAEVARDAVVPVL